MWLIVTLISCLVTKITGNSVKQESLFKANCPLASWCMGIKICTHVWSTCEMDRGTYLTLLPSSFQQSFPSGPSWGRGVPGPSFPGPSSSPSQLVLPRGLPRPSFPGPSSSPSQLVLLGGGGGPIWPIPVHHGKGHMGPPEYYGIDLDRLTDRQTCLKTLPSRKLRMRAVIIMFANVNSLRNPLNDISNRRIYTFWIWKDSFHRYSYYNTRQRSLNNFWWHLSYLGPAHNPFWGDWYFCFGFWAHLIFHRLQPSTWW